MNFDGLPNEKYTYLEQCDRFRLFYEGGEHAWERMMKFRIPVEREVFMEIVDVSTFLDDSDEVAYYEMQDPDTKFFVSILGEHLCVFVQSCGFEFIFVNRDSKEHWKNREHG